VQIVDGVPFNDDGVKNVLSFVPKNVGGWVGVCQWVEVLRGCGFPQFFVNNLQ